MQYTDDVLSCDFFQTYYNKTPYPDLTRGYFDSITNIYMSWRRQEPHETDLRTLAEKAAGLVMHGIGL